GVDRPQQREQPERHHRDQERVERETAGADAGAGRGPGQDHVVVVLMTRDRYSTIGTSEITSRTTAMAEPKPTRLASLMLLLVITVDSSSRPFLPRLMMYAMSNARSDSMIVTTTMMTLIGAMTGNTTWKNVCLWLAPSMAAASRSVGSTLFRPAR